MTSKANSTNWKADPQIDSLLQTGIDLKNKGDVEGAVAAFQQAIDLAPDCSLAYWLLGGMHYYNQENPKAALPFLKKAVKLSPRTERASLALFHALWDLGRVDDALKEIGRFQRLTNWACQDYLEIVAEIHDKWLGPSVKKPKDRRERKAIDA